MALNTTALATAYMARITALFTAGTIAYEEAVLMLANYIAALNAENAQAGDNVQSWTMAGKTFTMKDFRALRGSNHYRRMLAEMLGTDAQGSTVDMGGNYS